MEELRNYVEDRNKRSIAIFKHLHTSTKVELNLVRGSFFCTFHTAVYGCNKSQQWDNFHRLF